MTAPVVVAGRAVWSRVGLHTAMSGVPLLAISAHVFGWLDMHTATAWLLVPLLCVAGAAAVCAPHAVDRVVLAGLWWGVIACGFYDAVRLDTVYLLGWWGDFIPRMGSWVTRDPDAWGNPLIGYLWRYLGDGGGIGVVFFLAAAALGLHQHSRTRQITVAVGFAVFPVWAGLIATVILAPGGQTLLFPLTTTTFALSLLGHLIFGVVLGLGYARTDITRSWPWPPLRPPRAAPTATGAAAWPAATPPGQADPGQPGRSTQRPVRVLVVGGGAAGAAAARRLSRRTRPGPVGCTPPVAVTLIDPAAETTYRPFLGEVAAGAVEPRHLLVPLRRLLPHTRVLTGHVLTVDDTRRRVRLRLGDGSRRHIGYDVLVLAPGSQTRCAEVPGADRAASFRSAHDAATLRNLVLNRLEQAAATGDPDLAAQLLTFVVVGGGYAGIEALGELEDLCAHALRRHRPELPAPRWVLVHSGPRVLPELPAELAEKAADTLTRRGVQILTGRRVVDLRHDHVVLDDDTTMAASTVVWTTGTGPHPLLAASGLPVDDTGRLRTTPTLQVEGHPHIFAAGAAAAVPDLTDPEPGAVTAPTAQHATRQAPLLAANITALLSGTALRAYRHRHAGAVASLGAHRGVAHIHRLRLHGLPAWLLHRGYHLASIPTLERKLRIATDWALVALLGRDLATMSLPPALTSTTPTTSAAATGAADPTGTPASRPARRPASTPPPATRSPGAPAPSPPPAAGLAAPIKPSSARSPSPGPPTHAVTDPEPGRNLRPSTPQHTRGHTPGTRRTRRRSAARARARARAETPC